MTLKNFRCIVHAAGFVSIRMTDFVLSLFSFQHEALLLPAAEGVHDGREDDQENTTSGAETKDLVGVSIL